MCHLSFLAVYSNGFAYHIGIVYFQKTFLGIKNFVVVPCTLKIVVQYIFQSLLQLQEANSYISGANMANNAAKLAPLTRGQFHNQGQFG